MKTTHFGFRQIPVADKARKVAGVFNSVAEKYDIMNDLMSFGIHRLWKCYALLLAGVRTGQRVLDVAAGTGDLAMRLAAQVGPSGEVWLCDINNAMLARGRDRLIDRGLISNVRYVQADAENLPFREDYFDRITIAFGLRNVTDQAAALVSMYRVLKPGGLLLVLEFSKPRPCLERAYDFYSFNALPLMGRLVAGDADSYRYLAESIRMHPDQEMLIKMMARAGFERCEYFNLSAGIAAVHRGYKV
ncbi:MAG TPA: bifunctional demethylmenaquinone methyltransferase/2-methoxy-6-polyprenyl-1,4-benzoquinol methylase UbiE [Gammaproteobacteria bacterium]|nr:bifunctional demethylmenaquinone methyltransferase/2-methoxy-6-polyprenyl-1,4-benzoquinol methylase UbiE [Gammaproteobacteria bacterium]